MGYVNARTPVGVPAGLAWVLGAAVAVGVFSTVGHTVAGGGACHVEVMGTGATEGWAGAGEEHGIRMGTRADNFKDLFKDEGYTHTYTRMTSLAGHIHIHTHTRALTIKRSHTPGAQSPRSF